MAKINFQSNRQSSRQIIPVDFNLFISFIYDVQRMTARYQNRERTTAMIEHFCLRSRTNRACVSIIKLIVANQNEG